jgi:hypothetical protein
MESAHYKALIVYHVADDSISINGSHFVKYVPARILRKIVAAYVQEGRQEFEHREFTHDPAIIADPSNPNLGIRLQRLMGLFDAQFPRIALRRSSRGKIRFEPDCKVEFREQ